MFNKNLKAGFTLYELLISAAIISLIAGIVIYNHKRFETDIEITNLSYRIALTAREAQVYSVSVKPFTGAAGQNFQTSYGLHFNKNTDNSFIFFADNDDNGVYNQAVTDGNATDCSTDDDTECVEKISIGRGNVITGWCAILWTNNPGDQEQPCINIKDDANPLGSLDIRFKRPDPDAIFQVFPDGDYSEGKGVEMLCSTASGVEKNCSGWAICLKSPQGRQKRVVVYETGQISVENVEDATACGKW